MPRERQPKKGDFVLFEDDTFVIEKVKKKTVVMVSTTDPEIDEELLIDNLYPAYINVWEAE